MLYYIIAPPPLSVVSLSWFQLNIINHGLKTLNESYRNKQLLNFKLHIILR